MLIVLYFVIKLHISDADFLLCRGADHMFASNDTSAVLAPEPDREPVVYHEEMEMGWFYQSGKEMCIRIYEYCLLNNSLISIHSKFQLKRAKDFLFCIRKSLGDQL